MQGCSLCGPYICCARAVGPDRLKVHHSCFAVVMPMLMTVAMGISVVVTVAMRMIVAMVF